MARDMAANHRLLAAAFLLAHATAMTLAADQSGKRSVTLEHVESTKTSITVSWSRNDSGAASTAAEEAAPVYHVEAVNQATKVRLVGPPLPANESEYTLPDLAVDATFDLCLMAGETEVACAVLSTIPVVRDDSLIAVILALLILLLVVVIAVILWQCAIRRAGAGDDEETPSEEKPDHDDDEKHGGANEKAPLLETDQASPSPEAPAGTVSTQPEPASKEDQVVRSKN